MRKNKDFVESKYIFSLNMFLIIPKIDFTCQTKKIRDLR